MLTDVELKEKLIATIRTTDDEELLHQILRVIDLEARIDEVYTLSKEEEEAVKEGLAQLDNGQFITHSEANHQVDQWLKK